MLQMSICRAGIETDIGNRVVDAEGKVKVR